jgi:outer membrane protein OmpA-like peptidoglycan-associated protein
MRAPVTEPAPYVPKPNAPEVTQPTAPAPVERAATSLDTFFKGDEKLPAKVPIGKITFPFAATAPTADSMASIDQLATEMKNHPSAKVRLDGFTDSVGKGDANETLSIQRADAVKALLVDRGVDGSRIATGGHSLRHPVADNGTDNGRSENRRVEATLLSR